MTAQSVNPNIILLAYIPAIEIYAEPGISELRAEMLKKTPSAWELKNSSGGRVSYWPGTYVLNPTNYCPDSDGKKWNLIMCQYY